MLERYRTSSKRILLLRLVRDHGSHPFRDLGQVVGASPTLRALSIRETGVVGCADARPFRPGEHASFSRSCSRRSGSPWELALLYDLLDRSPDLIAQYTERGVLPVDTLVAEWGGACGTPFFYLSGSSFAVAPYCSKQ
jgi:hypothetical protein